MKLKNKILHLFGWDKKFVPPFIAFMAENFPLEDHHFIVYGAEPSGHLPNGAHITRYQNLLENLLPLLGQIRGARKVILHGLFSSHLHYALSMQPSLLKKCYWIIWGGDLYIHTAKRSDWRHRKNEWFRRFVVSRLGHLVTYVKGDYELAKQWYGACGQFHDCIMYPSNVVDPEILKTEERMGETQGLNFLVGNSADQSNNHVKILEKLAEFKGGDIRVYVPLSYGDQSNALHVINYGRNMLGDKFFPITDFMPLNRYLNFLKTIDIAIFGHKRQQAMGNAINLLGMGKTVYMDRGVSQWDLFSEIGVAVRPISEISLNLISMRDALNNQNIIASYFSKENLVTQLAHVFEG